MVHRVGPLSTQRDAIAWKLTTNGVYSAKSTYMLQFMGSVGTISNNLRKINYRKGVGRTSNIVPYATHLLNQPYV
uniref:Uncharacterized protein n=1 Tax=Oryza rufipogon TaxID=4529 RepID=A0A0E0RDL0_ORYRU